ncbi:SDR family NAD(P)-dependent oxidoreductase [Clostridium felsineum]|uniref:SDR family NAD(P)-dependent oxidoreductase n=1 Tax=Clostridium felsineum TaxID=36839 RepID=UPI00098C64BC|nr:SDR family oxidoreductase [Clostridium felsineum]URZ03584.1 3-oxoacyl-[acyl-carrier-protein] reductase FabG [Clostridium felsineum]
MGKNAVVIGGSKGIGFAIACKLALKKWNVTIVSSRKENLDKAREIAKKNEININVEVADATNEDSIKNLFLKLKQQGTLDLCINCVGKNLSQKLVKKTKDGEILMHSFEAWKNTIDINLNSVFLCGREEAGLMLEQNAKGTIVNIVTAVRNGAYGQSAYTAAKAGVTSLTRTWALELAKYGIRCVAIAPGAIEGEALINACKKDERHKIYMDKLREQIPLGRFASESEVADTVCFVAQNQYITGTVIELDGGGLPPKVFLK